MVLAGLLGMAALLVVGNTVRLDIQGRSDEIAVMQLLGVDYPRLDIPGRKRLEIDHGTPIWDIIA